MGSRRLRSTTADANFQVQAISYLSIIMPSADQRNLRCKTLGFLTNQTSMPPDRLRNSAASSDFFNTDSQVHSLARLGIACRHRWHNRNADVRHILCSEQIRTGLIHVRRQLIPPALLSDVEP